MEYVISYVLIGLLLSLVFDVLNEYISSPDDRIKFDWIMRIVNMVLWPYILGVFIRGLLARYVVTDELPDEELEE
tara:strand:- start:123 stop:347 length:225 start_codon:yes stop_codon:yes gene_type:complete